MLGMVEEGRERSCWGWWREVMLGMVEGGRSCWGWLREGGHVGDG